MTRYELTDRIGAGAMAEIFRGKAVASGGFEKPVAIKRILPHLSQDDRFVEILIAEANIVSHLRHRNIVQVFDVGLGPDGQYFVVMELVDGCNLGTLQLGLESRQKRMPVGLGLYIGAEICDALEHAHRAPGPDGRALRLVHRDVSPNNVLLSRSGEVKLTDFGIAKRSEEVSLHGGVRGKFAYISPEQGSGRSVDARSDVFSVGILLFEMIVGRRLFSSLPDFEALKAVCDGKVPRPRSVDPKLDPKLEAILLKALAHAPEERYHGAGELGKDLRGYRYSLPSTGGDPAAELASLVTRFDGQGRQKPVRKETAAPAVPRPQPDDFTGTTSTFTLEEDASLVRKTTYEEAWQKFREEESRVARSYQAASESGSMPSATMLGMSAAGAAYADDDDGDGDGYVAEEATRIVDPFLRASSRAGKDDFEGVPEHLPGMPSESSTNPAATPPLPKLSPKSSSKPSPKPSSRPSPKPSSQPSPKPSSQPLPQLSPQLPSQPLPQLSPQLLPKPLANPSAGAYSMTSARVPGSAAVLDDVEGVPPETLELHGSQALAMVDAVDAAVAAHEAALVPMARPAAAEPSSVIRVSAVPGGTSVSRMGFPRWAVILFVVLLVGIILAGFFLGDDTSSRATPAATAGSAALPPGDQPAAQPADPAAQDPAAVVPGTDPAAALAAATPDAGPAATQASDRVEDKPTRPRTAEKPRSSTTRKARQKTKDRQKRRRDRNR
jgi:serine/threonine-protein kinase